MPSSSSFCVGLIPIVVPNPNGNFQYRLHYVSNPNGKSQNFSPKNLYSARSVSNPNGKVKHFTCVSNPDGNAQCYERKGDLTYFNVSNPNGKLVPNPSGESPVLLAQGSNSSFFTLFLFSFKSQWEDSLPDRYGRKVGVVYWFQIPVGRFITSSSVLFLLFKSQWELLVLTRFYALQPQRSYLYFYYQNHCLLLISLLFHRIFPR